MGVYSVVLLWSVAIASGVFESVDRVVVDASGRIALLHHKLHWLFLLVL